METKLTADVVVLLDGQPFDIAQALAEVHRRVALVRAIEREAQRLYRDARACVA